jgi:hypothetical protein
MQVKKKYIGNDLERDLISGLSDEDAYKLIVAVKGIERIVGLR